MSSPDVLSGPIEVGLGPADGPGEVVTMGFTNRGNVYRIRSLFLIHTMQFMYYTACLEV